MYALVLATPATKATATANRNLVDADMDNLQGRQVVSRAARGNRGASTPVSPLAILILCPGSTARPMIRKRSQRHGAVELRALSPLLSVASR